MKISNVGVSSTPLTPQQQADSIAAGGEQAPSSGVAAETSAYTPSAKLTKLIELARQQPEVRLDRVEAATQRLQEGAYHTSAAAGQTAAAMLGTLD